MSLPRFEAGRRYRLRLTTGTVSPVETTIEGTYVRPKRTSAGRFVHEFRTSETAWSLVEPHRILEVSEA